MTKRLCTILLVFAVVLAALPISAAAAALQQPDILALGDSITYGTGLEPQTEKRFTALLDPYYGNVINKGVDGNTAPGLLRQFADGTVTDEEIRAAEIITITCGGNDLMAVMYEKMVASWNEVYPSMPLKSTDITKIFSGELESNLRTKIALIQFALNLMDREHEDYMMSSPEFQQGLDDFIAGLHQVMDHLHTVNPDAKILVATQYNPYVEFKDKVLSVFLVQFNLHLLYDGMEDGTTQLNNRIREHAAAGGYTVMDVKEAFDRYTGTGDLYQATYSTNMDKFSVDFHPAEEGHAVIAETIRKTVTMINLKANWKDGKILTEHLNPNAAFLLIAAYDDALRMVDCQYEALSGDPLELEIQVSGEICKLFLLDSHYVPICTPIQMP